MSASWMAWGSLALSTVALLLAVVTRWRQARSVGEDFNRIQSRALSLDLDGLSTSLTATGTAFAGWQELLGRLDSEHSAWSGSAVEDDFFEANPRFVRFIDLQMAWEKKTGQRLRGAAIEDGRKIEELTGPDSRTQSTDEANLIFTVTARRVVEYMVHASGTGVSAADEDQVGRLLEEMADLAEIRLIDPARGERPNRQMHDSVGTVAAGSNQRGTIAKVEVRGLVRGNGSVMKAKVYLYD